MTRKRLGFSELRFDEFISFSVRRGEEELQFFKCGNKDILSGKLCIKKMTAEEKWLEK